MCVLNTCIHSHSVTVYMPFYIFKQIVRQQIARWVVMFFIGVFTGLIASFIDVMIELLSEVKFSNVKRCIL